MHVLLLCALLSAEAAPDLGPVDTRVDTRAAEAQAAEAKATQARIEALIEGMSDSEKVAQLMVVGFSGTQVNRELEELIGEWHVGAVALFSRNIESPTQTRKLTQGIRGLARGVPPFVAIDQEGGIVVRLKQGVFILPSAMALGATRSRALAFLGGRALASDLRALGISMNLAPVLDVNSNPANPVIGTRSIGERPELVADLGTWFVRGQEEGGVVTVAKHFPGHGDTQTDSHFDLPQLPHNLERLKKLEFVPFKAAFAAGLDAVMTAHIALPAVAEAPNLPATLSHRLLTTVLREDLGFSGLILTDGLEMRGIVEGEGIGEAAVKAILAGADMVMVLWSKQDRQQVFDTLKTAYANGTISKARMRASLRRILATKERRGVMGPQVIATTDVQRMLHDQLADEIAERAVTLVRSHGDLLPTTAKRVLVLEPEGQVGALLGAQDDVQMPVVPTRERRQHDVTAAIAKSANADVIVAVAQNRYHVEVIRAVREAVPTVPMIFVSMSSPYYLSLVPSADAYLCTYSSLPSAQRALVKVLLGQRGTVGRLPVTIPGLYPYGAGVVEGSDADASLGSSKKFARTPK